MKNNFFNIHEIILIITVVELFFLVILSRLLPRNQIQSMKVLSYFFVLVMGVLGATILIWNPQLQATIAVHSVLPILLLCVCLLLEGPVLFLYLKSLSSPVDFWSKSNVVHLIPALLAAVVILYSQVDIFDWLPWNWSSLAVENLRAVKFVWFLVRCSPLVYVLACAYLEFQLRRRHKNEFSSSDDKELLFADILLAGFFIHWFWSFIAYFIGGYLDSDTNDLLGILNNYLTVILVNVLFVFGLMNTRKFLSQTEQRSRADVVDLDAEKIAMVESGMLANKLFLDSHLNLERFSAQIGLKPKEVSQIINHHFKTNFFEFINGYRVEEAKRLLTDKEHKADTVLDIVYKSGFNSQSAFHRFFKRMVGVSPSEYRAQFLEK